MPLGMRLANKTSDREWELERITCFTSKFYYYAKLQVQIGDEIDLGRNIYGKRIDIIDRGKEQLPWVHIGETCFNKLLRKKINMFVWHALRGHPLVLKELDKRGINLNSVLCPWCYDHVELVDRSLVGCKVSEVVWESVFHGGAYKMM